MSTIFGSLNLGRLGLLAQQYTMHVLGNNIANVNTPGYTRRRLELVPTPPSTAGTSLQFGTGVRAEEVLRIRDTFLDIYLRNELGTLGDLNQSNAAYKQIEVIFNELSDQGRSLSGMMSEFWNSWQALSTEPEHAALRQAVISNGDSLAGTFRYMRDRLYSLRVDLNTTVNATVDEINTLAIELQTLNTKIIESGGGGGGANDYRDQRDLILDRLSELANITERDLGSGEQAVFINGQLLVSAMTVRTIETEVNSEGLYDVKWADTGNVVEPNGGELKGLLDSRDTTIPDYIERVDALATQIIKEVNRLHAQGNGLTRYTTATSGIQVNDPDGFVDYATGIPFESEIQDGSFWLAVYDADGTLLEENEITITTGVSTLNTVATEITADFFANGYLTASVVNKQLVVELGAGAPADATFSFVKNDGTGDTSNFLMAMELNTFFSGEDAETIDIASTIEADPSLIATASSISPGDNVIALAIGNLRNQELTIGTEPALRTFDDYQQLTIAMLGIESATAGDLTMNQDNVVNALEQRRQAYSGVNLDEELSNLISVEHAYTASARYIMTIEEMLDDLLSIA